MREQKFTEAALTAAIAEMGRPATASEQVKTALAELSGLIRFPHEMSTALVAAAKQGDDEAMLQNFEAMLSYACAWGLTVGRRMREIETEFQSLAARDFTLPC